MPVFVKSDNPHYKRGGKHASDNGKSLGTQRTAVRITYLSGNPDSNSPGHLPSVAEIARDGMEPPKTTDEPIVEAGKTIEQSRKQYRKHQSAPYIVRVIIVSLTTGMKFLHLYICTGIESSCKVHILLKCSQKQRQLSSVND